MRKLRRIGLGALCAALMALGAVVPASGAAPEPDFRFAPSTTPPGAFEGPCGLGVDRAGNFYVSDYYHHTIDLFSSGRSYVTQLTNVDPPDGPCGLALDATTSNLYVNNYHRNVVKYGAAPAFGAGTVLDSSHPTGVAVDRLSGNVFVNARTYVAVYSSAGAPLMRIGEGSLLDGYGVAVSSYIDTAGYVYVPDAGDDTVKVYDPTFSLDDPWRTIDGSDRDSPDFLSLHDSVIAVDNESGEVYVADTLGPQQTERPQATIQIFNPDESYRGHLKYNIYNASPPGLAIDNSNVISTKGRVYVTSGTTVGAIVYIYPPDAATTGPTLDPLGAAAAPPPPSAEESTQAPPAAAGPPAVASVSGPPAPSTAAISEIAQRGNLRVFVSGKLDYKGLPTCNYNRIQPGSSSRALAGCRDALVGRGSFTANITLAGQEPYPTKGRLLVFNSVKGGKQVLFGHIYAGNPFATSFVIVFRIQRLGRGIYGTVLNAPLPKAMDAWGRLTGFEMTLAPAPVRRKMRWQR